MPEITVFVVPNPLEPEQREEYRVRALVPWLVERYGTWPATARLYHVYGSTFVPPEDDGLTIWAARERYKEALDDAFAGRLEVDVTPTSRVEVEALEDLPGPFVVRERPAGSAAIVSAGIATAVGGLIATPIAVAVQAFDNLLSGKHRKPGPVQKAQRTSKGSPNVTLNDRSNKARPEERIPDIYGTVRSIPDLLMQPYNVYVGDQQQEIGYYCIGRGTHLVNALADGPQLIGNISGASAAVYGPGAAPTGGPGLHAPQTLIGTPIDDDVYTVHRVGAVNGQELHAAFQEFTFYMTRFSSDPALAGGAPIPGFVFYVGGAVGRIALPYSTAPEEITDRVAVGESLMVVWHPEFQFGGVGTAPDLSTPLTSTAPLTGAFLTVTAIDSDNAHVNLTVNIPAAQQAQWALLATYYGAGAAFPGVGYFFAQFTNVSRIYTGPLFVDFQHPVGFSNFQFICNFVAPQGLYKDDGTTTRTEDLTIIVLLTPANSSGTPIGTTQFQEQLFSGSAVLRGQRAITMRIVPSIVANNTRFLLRAYIGSRSRRERQHDTVEVGLYGANLSDPSKPFYTYYSGRIVDEVRWVDCYSMSTPPNISFGDITTVHTRTIATDGAVRVRERQLNCVATRMIQTWNGVTFGGALTTSGFGRDMLFSILKDPFIGNLPDASIDFPGIAAAFDTVLAKVFDSSPLATAFSHTFDDADLSLEETVQILCQACFATAYRDGTVVKVRPEIAHDDSVLVLNHRNVRQGSQRITHAFGQPTENDSIECVYLDPNTGQSEKVSVPFGITHLRPRQLNVLGLQLAKQAYWHAYRAYFRMLYQRQSLALHATQEAGILRTLDRVLVADLTRSSGVQDGEILAQSGTAVQTSQPVVLVGGKTYTLYLQAPDGTVQERAVTASPGAFKLTLASAPSPAPITDSASGVRTLYLLVADDQATPRAFLVSETSPDQDLTHEVTGVNYSHLYYLADGMQAWVIFTSLADLSPYQHTFTNHGGTVSGGVWTGAAAAFFHDDIDDFPTPSYTKHLRIHPTAAGSVELLGNDFPQSEFFNLDVAFGNPTLNGGHNGANSVSAIISLGVDLAVTLTYDAVTLRMALFVDGVLRSQNASVAAPSGTGQLSYLFNFAGTCSRLARWGRALSDREVEEIFLRGI